MKTILDKETREELIRRINALDENCRAQWGAMDVYQMVKHCTLWEEMAHGKTKSKRVFLGHLFGKLALKSMIGDDRPVRRNMSTLPQLRVHEVTGDFPAAKNKWISFVKEYENFPDEGFVHPFMGKITREQAGYLAYKHTDHHLRQFEC